MYGLIVLAAYAILMIVTTLAFTKKETTAEGFLLGNRKIGMTVSALSIAASWIWAPALFTSAERAYLTGWVGLFWFLVPNVLCLILFIPFAKKIRLQMPHGMSLSGYMGEKYRSKKVKGIYNFQLGALALFSTAVQLLAGSKMLHAITGWPFWLLTVILAVIAFSYAQFSGLKASVVTDAFQMVFMLVVAVGFVVFGVVHGNNTQGLIKGLSGVTGEFSSLFSEKGIEVALGFGIPTAIGLLSGPFGDQRYWQRAFSLKDKVGKAFAIGALLFAVVPLSMGILGFISAGGGYEITDTGMVNFQLITQIFPAWTVVPFLFMIISGLLSSVDSNLCAAASLVADSDKPYSVVKSKAVMLIMLAVSVGIANIPGLTVTHLFMFYGTFRASTLLTTVMTLKGVKLTGKGVFTGVLCALLIGYPIFAYGNLFNVAVFKTLGSLTTVLMSGIVSYFVSRREVRPL